MRVVIFLIAKGFWLFMIFATWHNAALWRRRGERHIRERPELASRYATLTKGLITWGNVPWVVMGIGCTVGGVPAVFSYFRPQDGNPCVLAFWVSLVLLWILGFYWMFFRGGAQALADCPGLLSEGIRSALMIKFLYVLGVASGVAAIIMMLMDDPASRIP